MNELKKILKPLKIKLIFERYIKRFFEIGCIVLFFYICIEIYSKFSNIKYINHINLISFFIILIVPLIIVIFYDKIDYFKVAKKCDSLGYQERFITAYEILFNKNQYYINDFVVNDAFDIVKNDNITKKYNMTFPCKFIILFIILSICAFVVGFVKPYGKENFEIYINRELEEIKRIEKITEKNSEVNKDDLKELKKELKSLNSEIKNAMNKEDAKKILEKTEQNLKKLEKQSFNNDITKISDFFEESKQTKNLSYAIKNGDLKNIENAIKDLNDISSEQKNDIFSGMKNLSDSISSDDLRNSMNQISDGSLSDENISDIANSISKLSRENSQLRDSIKNINNNISSAKSDLEQENQGQENQGQENQGQENQGQENQGQENQGQKNQEYEDTSKNKQNNNFNLSGQSKGYGDGKGNNDEIYTRNAINKSHIESKIGGVQGDNGNINISNESTIGSVGEKVNYSEVYSQYKYEAIKNMEKSDIPYGMKDIVIDYFSTLEE